MEIIYTFITHFEDGFLMGLGAIIALIVVAVGIYITIRNHKNIVSYDIEYRKVKSLKKLDDLIQEFKRYVYSFDAETYSKRKQPNESFLTYKSDQLNARLEKLINLRAKLKQKRFDSIESVERTLKEINAYVKSTHGMMIKLRSKVKGNKKVRGDKMDNGHHSF